MHEWSLAQGLLKQVEQICLPHQPAKVKTIRVAVGELAGVEPECLHSAFSWLAEGSLAQGATLELKRVPLEGFCEACQRQGEVVSFHFVCPHCGSKQMRIVSGEDLILQEVVLESSEGS